MAIRQLTAVVITAASLIGSTAARAEELWRLVAQSHLIVVGEANPPSADISSAQDSNQHRYIDIPISAPLCLKGACPENLRVSYYTRPAPYSPSPRQVLDASGKRSIFFLIKVDYFYTNGIYFAGYTPSALRSYSTTSADDIRQEVEAQRAILDRGVTGSERDPLYQTVKALVNGMTNAETEAISFKQLEALGDGAIPSIIALMDDRRPLPVRHIALVNTSPNAFEGLRHYSPELVVDALDAILNQIAGENFGGIFNGGSERARKLTVDAWRIYLAHRPAKSSS